MSLATKIKKLRLSKNESLQDLASAIGISKTHLWELEQNRSKNPSINLIEKLADHYKITIASLLGEEIEENNTNEEMVRMFRQAGELSDEDRTLLDDVIQSMRRRNRETSN